MRVELAIYAAPERYSRYSAIGSLPEAGVVSARLSVSPANGTVPLTVTADASRSTAAGSGSIVSYTFEFGDGSPMVGPQSGATAAHTYEAPGIYAVRVRVEDADGQISEDIKRVRAR
jgi:PKD repeat protein